MLAPKSDESQLPFDEILLELKIAISRHEDGEARGFGRVEQLSVLQPGPRLLLDRSNVVPGQKRRELPRKLFATRAPSPSQLLWTTPAPWCPLTAPERACPGIRGRSYGVANVETKAPISDNTIFEAGSVSKNANAGPRVFRRPESCDCILVTKDEDFHRLSVLRGAPPKVIWLRLGNCTTDEVAELLRRHAIDIEQFGGQVEITVLELG